MRRYLLIGLLASTIGVALPGSCGAISLQLSGYSASLYLELPNDAVYEDIEADQSGSLYLAVGSLGIRKVQGGVASTWSTGGVDDLVLGSSHAYGAGRSLCDCVLRFGMNGSYSTLHQDSLSWSFVTIGPDSTLYASISVGTGKGLYVLDRGTGNPTQVVPGGPVAGGSGRYYGMAFGSDGKLYVLGAGSGSGGSLYRLDGTQLTSVATLDHTGLFLTLGPGGVFYVSAQYLSGTGFINGEIWIVDPSSGNTTLLAKNGSYPGLTHPTFGGIAYDSGTATLYVAEANKLWAIMNSTPAQRESWGSIKARYR